MQDVPTPCAAEVRDDNQKPRSTCTVPRRTVEGAWYSICVGLRGMSASVMGVQECT